MDISIAYGCLLRNLLIAKLEAYELVYSSRSFILHYPTLRKQKQRSRTRSSWSNRTEILGGKPQDSLLDP